MFDARKYEKVSILHENINKTWLLNGLLICNVKCDIH